MRALMHPITEQEIKDIIIAFKNNRAPGPDGLSIEFYKTMFPYIKNELTQLFNGYLKNGRILAETKSSFIKLIPKRTPYNLVENFRPISLLNCDYKIFTKILSKRLQPILDEIVHESQYAQPGKNINDLNTLARDIIGDMSNSVLDSFFVSVDFRKAYDTVCHKYLFQILEKYGFPTNFINVIKEIFRDAGSHILINGYKSKKKKLNLVPNRVTP